MAVIKSGNSTDQLSIDATSKAARVTLYDSAGNEKTSLPISGSVSVSNFPATQPVSGPLTDTQLRASAVPVSTSSLPLPSGASTEVTLALIKAKTDNLDVLLSSRTKPSDIQSVSGSVSVSNFPATQPISATSLPLPSGAATSALQTTGNSSLANLDVLLSTRLKPADTLTKVATVDTITNPVAVTGTFFQATQPISGSVSVNNFPAIQATTASDTLTKGVQGATGFSVQPLRDAGRVIKTYVANQIASVTSEALATLQPQTDGTNGSTGTSFTVTAGKRLRLQHFVVSTRASAAAVARSTFFLRMSSTGAVTTASPIIAIAEPTGPSATAVTGGQVAISLPDGIELSGSMQFGVSHVSPVATHVENITLIGYEY